jgi:transcriptional regulator with XRE-family HTH domain
MSLNDTKSMISKRIKELRKHLKKNQTDFGKGIGVTHSAISQIETGDNAPGEQTIALICATYNVNRTWLETGKGEMFTETSIDSSALCSAPDFCQQICEICKKLEPSRQIDMLKIGQMYLDEINESKEENTTRDSNDWKTQGARRVGDRRGGNRGR